MSKLTDYAPLPHAVAQYAWRLPKPNPNTLGYYAQHNPWAWAASERQVNWYIDHNGRYVPTHHRTVRNNTTLDNYTTLGNFNPHTGRPGYRTLGPLDLSLRSR